MKNFTTYLFVLSLCISSYAQNESFLWPIQGKKTGENILFRPNDQIADELNSFDLIISAEENSIIVSPVTGVVTNFNYSYHIKYSSSLFFGVSPSNDFSADVNEILKSTSGENIDTKYISITMAIKISDGRTIWIQGIRPEKIFKTGEKITQGDIIGKVGYLYYKINKPCIALQISKNGKADDPMLPFGLQSTFKKFETKTVINLTKQEALEDINILTNAIEEGYPGLFDYFTIEDWKNMIVNMKNEVSDNMEIYNFWEIIYYKILNKLRDNHIGISACPTIDRQPSYIIGGISFGFLNDSLVITRTSSRFKDYWGKRILEINGISADSIKQIVISKIPKIDGYVQSHLDCELLLWTWFKFDEITENSNHEYKVKFSNDSVVFFPSSNEKNSLHCAPSKHNLLNFYRHNTDSVTLSTLSDSIAYMGINSFFLNDLEMEKIRIFIKDAQEKSIGHIIIDLRNNSGGDERICAQLFSYFAQKPFIMHEYMHVKKKTDFDFFSYCTNYSESLPNLFPEFEPISSKEGYFYFNNDTIRPDVNINFKGNLYVITNERSLSASTDFAGLVHKHNRGVIIGRETGNTYRQMNALKFAHLLLPNSQIQITIPLVKIVFDGEDNKIPFGRGVIPHYPINFSLEEIWSICPDTMMNYTLQLISDGKYFMEDELNSYQESTLKFQLIKYSTFLASFGIIVIFLMFFIKYKKNKNE
ncbi:MAG: S41 family peptidase [Marinilabiliaceae bacterium]|nr:S41 family peptidase [Marinilabiliaceae bacterium]